ncbi:MAG: hypothetical protein HOP15_10310 [Planctomycetes bacterium]|nr:hypothetical protein [Planctomycetota bacterium]
MNKTLALIQKDRVWLTIAACTGAVACTVLLFELRFENVFVLPGYGLVEGLWLLLPLLAALLAGFQVAREHLSRTSEYVRQRAITPQHLYWSQTVAAVTVLLSWPVVAVALLWLRELVFGFGAAGADARGWGILAAGTSLGLATHALTLFVLTLPLAWVGRVALGILTAIALLALQSVLVSFEPPWLVFALLHGGLALALWMVARVNSCTPHDPDRPLPRSLLLVAAPLVAVCAALFGAIVTSSWEASSLQRLQMQRPWIVEIAPDQLALVRPVRAGVQEILDEGLAPTGRLASGRSLGNETLAPRPAEPRFDPFDVRSVYHWQRNQTLWIRGGVRNVELTPWGSVRIIDRLESGRSAWALERPGSGRFSKRAFLREARRFSIDQELLFLIDPESPGIWRIDAETPPVLVPLPLPGGERPVKVCSANLGVNPTHTAGNDWVDVVVGEQHAWQLTIDGWQPVESSRVLQPFTLTLHDADPFQPDVEVLSSGGQRLRHRYTLATGKEMFLAGLTCVGAVLRPLPLALFAATQDYDDIGRSLPHETRWLFDPLLGGGFAWLLAPSALLCLLLATLARRELRQRGASHARANSWAAVILVGGVFGALVVSLIETRRAWRAPARSAPLPVVIRAA